METAILVLVAVATVGAIVAALGAWRRPRPASDPEIASRIDETERRVTDALARTHAALEAATRDSMEHAGSAQRDLADRLSARLDAARDSQADATTKLQANVEARLEAIRAATEAKLDVVRAETEKQLEKIRATVDEKLHATLEQRLGDSFKLVTERLEQVHRGLGEMQKLSGGVDDLKRVLSNVKSRGTFGEVQLGALLDEVFTRGQYDTNVATRPDSNERVEFAIRLPGHGDGPVYLPIDAKFPTADFERLQQALDAANGDAADAARKDLRARITTEAKKIREKYVAPPQTTDFALLFLPTEGLFAEALREPGLSDTLRRDHHVVLVGPTTLYAILNSLQMGFRTLAIEKRSAEVWRVLGAVKTEFARFGDALDAVKKKLEEASTKMEATATRSRAIGRRLHDVEALPEGVSQQILQDGDAKKVE